MILRTLVRRFSLLAGAVAFAGSAFASPFASVTFSPTAVRQGEQVRFGIGVSDNTQAILTNITLLPGVFTYPAGLTNSTTPPDSSCGGVVVALPGTNTVSFSGGTSPSFGCSVYLYLDTSIPGTFTATINQGDVTTDQGPTTIPWSDTLTVTPAQVVTNTLDAGPGSLRDALAFINANCVGPYTIAFDLPGPSFVIQPLSALPPITCGNVLVDGYTQPGSAANGSPLGSNSAIIGVELDGSACTACDGLASASYGNVIRGLAIHSFPGSGISSSSGNVDVYGSYIGTDRSGNAALGNGVAGIDIGGGSATIGTTAPADANLISGNGKGIWVDAGRAVISGNQIGGFANGATGGGNGIGIYFDTNSFNGDALNNAIHYQSGAGIVVSPNAGSGYVFLANAISANGGIGIDLNDDGPSPNDEASSPYDLDGGANGTLNYPVITNVVRGSDTMTVSGYLKTRCCYTGTVEVYANLQLRPGITEGAILLGTTSVSADVNGDGLFSLTVPGVYDYLSATLTFDICGDGCMDSSEYSPTFSTLPPALPVLTPGVATLSFNAIVAYSADSQTLALANTGTGNLNFAATPFTTTAEFTVASSTCTTVLAPGSSCTVVIGFVPSTNGVRTGTLTIASDAPSSPASVALQGYGYLPLQASIVTPGNPVAGSATTVSLQVTNPNAAGAAPFTGVAGSVTIPAGFVIDSTLTPTCTADVPPTYTVAPGETCSLYSAALTAAVTPGAYTFQVPAGALRMTGPTPWDNSAQGATLLTVTVVPGSLSVSPSSLSFGSIVVGNTTPAQNVTITTSSRLPVPVKSIVASAGFIADATACGTAIPLTGCSVTVRFAPTTTGSINGTLTIDAGGGTYSVALSGTATSPAVPAMTVTPGALTFPARTVGTTSPGSTVSLTNSGTANLAINGITTVGDFGFVSTCAASLAPGASCTIDIRFSPLVPGARSGVLTIATNAPGSPATVALSGQGIASLIGILDLTPSLLDFGSQGVGTTSAIDTIEIVNTGSALVGFSVAVTGPFALVATPSAFSACTGSLAPGGACVVALTFTPTQPGPTSGSLVVTSDASNPRATVTLAGSGVTVAPPRALVVPDRIDFGTQAFGSRSAGRPLTISNSSGQAVVISELLSTGDFSIDDGCATVPAHGSCTVLVYFTPTARGNRDGQVTLRAQSESQSYFVALSGNGGPNPNPVMTVSPLHIGFGNALVGPAQVTATIELTNTGEVPVSLGTLSPPGDFIVTSHCGASIAVGTHCALDVAFFPRVVGLRAGVLDIPSNASNGPHRVELSGVGCSLPNAGRNRIAQLVCSP